MRFRSRAPILMMLALLLALAACSDPSGDGQGADVDANPTAPPQSNCYPGVVRNAVANIEDLSSYTVHNWDYLERTEGSPRELYIEEVLNVTRENGTVADTDSAITIYFDEFHRADYVRVDGMAFVRHNEEVWEPIEEQSGWDITWDGVMGDTLGFYEALTYVQWKDGRFQQIADGDPYCEATAIDINGTQAWKFTFYNAPQSLFFEGFGGKRGGAGGSDFSQEKLQSGWKFQSADYSATVIGFDADTRLVGESMRIESGDGNGNSFYTTWETEWNNFNEPVTIRQPQQ